MTTTQLEPENSTSVLDFWEHHSDDYEICGKAIGMLLRSQANLVGKLNSLDSVEQILRQKLEEVKFGNGSAGEVPVWSLALAQIVKKSGRSAEADTLSQQAIDIVLNSDLDSSEISEMAEQLIHLLQHGGLQTTAESVRRRWRLRDIRLGNNSGQLIEVRGLAFDAYRDGQYGEAEDLYRFLLEKDFETAGTHCHLARVFLTTGRDREASAAVESAWRMREGSPPFVFVRIHYLRAVLAALAQQNCASHLTALNTALQVPGSHYAWLLQPLLDAIQRRLPAETHALFSQLADALTDRIE